jgi:Skp family chaperone for outer membrane proteins
MPHPPKQLAPFQRTSAGSAAFGAVVSLAFTIALGAVAFPAAAATYKWTDANGRVIYSDQPPNGNFKVEAINAPPPPANPNAVKELANKEAELQQKKVLRADEEAKLAKTRAETDKKREQCAKVRGQIAMMQSDQNALYFRSNEKGEPVYMDDAARRKERDQLEGWMRENCSS